MLEQQRDLYRLLFVGLASKLALQKQIPDWDLFGGIDWQKPDAITHLLAQFIAEGFPAGAYEDIEIETIQAVCTELHLPDVYEQWCDEIDESCAQNRALIEADEDNLARLN